MLITKKMLLALTLIGALVGAGIGALATRATSSETAQAASADDSTRTANTTNRTPEQLAAENGSQFSTAAEQSAYRQGFNEGFTSCTSAQLDTSTQTRTSAVYQAPARRTSNTRRVYYDYGNQPRGRTFWQKHRDKLTVAMGTGAGALIGGLIGGKRGAGIGMLAGGGSSALYTYKIRKRARRY